MLLAQLNQHSYTLQTAKPRFSSNRLARKQLFTVTELNAARPPEGPHINIPSRLPQGLSRTTQGLKTPWRSACHDRMK
jgi:hypothetical protein